MEIVNINKTSAEDGSALSGATYTITPMEKSGDSWVQNSEGTSYKRNTKSDGTIRVAGLKRDTLYEIKEVAVPAGYLLDETLVYLVFLFESGSDSGYPAGTKIIQSVN